MVNSKIKDYADCLVLKRTAEHGKWMIDDLTLSCLVLFPTFTIPYTELRIKFRIKTLLLWSDIVIRDVIVLEKKIKIHKLENIILKL